jgi:uncharacterized membrane protein YphA (DoxX/SURF4 family)
MADTEEPMSETLLYRALGVLLAPSSPVASAVATVVRLAAGAILIGFGQSKFVHHAKEVRSFDRYGLPAPEVFTYAIGTAELVGGILLVVGLMTRLVALTLLVAMLFLVWAGAGRFALDDLLARRVGPAEPVDESSRNRHVHVTDT